MSLRTRYVVSPVRLIMAEETCLSAGPNYMSPLRAWRLAQALVPLIVRLSPDTERTGGVVRFTNPYPKEYQVFLQAPVGLPIPPRGDDDIEGFYRFSDEKTRRLIRMHKKRGDLLASQSADEGRGQYGGAVMSGPDGRDLYRRLVISVSAWKPMLDEAYAFGLHLLCGTMSEERARQLADGQNQYLLRLLDLMKQG